MWSVVWGKTRAVGQSTEIIAATCLIVISSPVQIGMSLPVIVHRRLLRIGIMPKCHEALLIVSDFLSAEFGCGFWGIPRADSCLAQHRLRNCLKLACILEPYAIIRHHVGHGIARRHQDRASSARGDNTWALASEDPDLRPRSYLSDAQSLHRVVNHDVIQLRST